MNRFWIVDNAFKAKGEIYEIPLTGMDKNKAMAEARREWDQLTLKEKHARDNFFLAYGWETEAGVLDYDNMLILHSFKDELFKKPDMSITGGHIIDNPTFDTELAYKIVRWNDEENDHEVLYDSRQDDDDPPAELLTETVSYMTIDDGQLILEVW